MNKKLILFLALVGFVFGYTVYEAMKIDKKLGDNSYSQTGTIIKNMPSDLKFSNYKTGEHVDLGKMAADGSNLLIHFWATWCAPCEVEFPELIEMVGMLKDKKDLKIVFVAVDDEPKKVQKFLKKIGIDKISSQVKAEQVLLLKDNIKDYRRFGTYKLPETFLVGKNNKVIRKFTGGQPWTQKFLVDYFLAL